MDITLSFLAKSLDKHGITLVHITYPPLDSTGGLKLVEQTLQFVWTDCPLYKLKNLILAYQYLMLLIEIHN